MEAKDKEHTTPTPADTLQHLGSGFIKPRRAERRFLAMKKSYMKNFWHHHLKEVQ